MRFNYKQPIILGPGAKIQTLEDCAHLCMVNTDPYT